MVAPMTPKVWEYVVGRGEGTARGRHNRRSRGDGRGDQGGRRGSGSAGAGRGSDKGCPASRTGTATTQRGNQGAQATADCWSRKGAWSRQGGCCGSRWDSCNSHRCNCSRPDSGCSGSTPGIGSDRDPTNPGALCRGRRLCIKPKLVKFSLRKHPTEAIHCIGLDPHRERRACRTEPDGT